MTFQNQSNFNFSATVLNVLPKVIIGVPVTYITIFVILHHCYPHILYTYNPYTHSDIYDFDNAVYHHSVSNIDYILFFDHASQHCCTSSALYIEVLKSRRDEIARVNALEYFPGKRNPADVISEYNDRHLSLKTLTTENLQY